MSKFKVGDIVRPKRVLCKDRYDEDVNLIFLKTARITSKAYDDKHDVEIKCITGSITYCGNETSSIWSDKRNLELVTDNIRTYEIF